MATDSAAAQRCVRDHTLYEKDSTSRCVGLSIQTAGQPKTALLTVSYVEIIPLLVAAVQEQQKKLTELEADVKP
jgi:hypothetical protein